jgi:glucose-1-phosphate thymidylyltransferase
MIYYPIETLVDAGVRDILIVTGGESAGDFLKLLGNGAGFGLKHLNYTYQEGNGGIAEALGLAAHFVGEDSVIVILGDNILEHGIGRYLENYRRQGSGARILLKEVPDPYRFGVAEVDGDRVVQIREKPKQPKTNFAVTGVYFYDSAVFEIVKTLRPSDRGELEITDVNNAYIQRRAMGFDVMDGWWTDAGTFESLHRANVLVAKMRSRAMSGPGR